MFIYNPSLLIAHPVGHIAHHGRLKNSERITTTLPNINIPHEAIVTANAVKGSTLVISIPP